MEGKSSLFATNLVVFGMFWSGEKLTWLFLAPVKIFAKIGEKRAFHCKICQKVFFFLWTKVPGRMSMFPGRFRIIQKSWSVNWLFLGISCLVAKLVLGNS